MGAGAALPTDGFRIDFRNAFEVLNFVFHLQRESLRWSEALICVKTDKPVVSRFIFAASFSHVKGPFGITSTAAVVSSLTTPCLE